MQDPVAFAPPPRLDEARRVRAQVAVGQHHALWPARRATREDDERRTVAVVGCGRIRGGGRSLWFLRRHNVLYGEEGAALAVSDGLRQRSELLARGGHEACIRLLDRIAQLVGGMRDAQWDGDATGLPNAQHRAHILDARSHEERDAPILLERRVASNAARHRGRAVQKVFV